MSICELPEAVGSERIAYEGRILEIFEQTMRIGEKTMVYEFARRPPGVRLLIVSPDRKILLTEEFRPEIQGWDVRLPGGKVFDTLAEFKGVLECPEQILAHAAIAARKEALEEAGLDVEEVAHFVTVPCGATIIWDLYYFTAHRFKAHPQGQKLELGENIRLRWVDFTETKFLCLERHIREGNSAAVLMQYLHQVAPEIL